MAGGISEYDPSCIKKIEELMLEGASITECAWHLRIARSTLYNWMELYPELVDAIKKGKEFSQGWWEHEGRTSLRDKNFNPTLWYMNMKNRFGWADRQEQAHTVTVTDTNTKVENAKDAYQKPY